MRKEDNTTVQVGIIIGGVFIVFLPIILAFASESTFGQRCHNYFPNATSIQIDRCVEYLKDNDSLGNIENYVYRGQTH